jgi:hypothetical protein
MFELTLTRIFSIIQWNYLAFMIISIAFLGYGASGTFLTVTPSLTNKNRIQSLPDLLSRFALIYGLSILVALFLIMRIPFDLYRLNVDHYQWLFLAFYYLAIALPFFFAGTCISLAITHLPEKVSRLYFYDLTGASLGCLAFLYFYFIYKHNQSGYPAGYYWSGCFFSFLFHSTEETVFFSATYFDSHFVSLQFFSFLLTFTTY